MPNHFWSIEHCRRRGVCRLALGVSGRAGPYALVGALFALATPAISQAETATVEVTVDVAIGELRSIPHPGMSTPSSASRGNFGLALSAAQRLSSSSSISTERSTSVRLPSGGRATLRLVGMDGSAYRISITVPGGSSVITAAPGGVFYVNAGRHSGGTLVLILRF